ncbi:Calpain-7 [Larimichthys crocea]|uniref:Uncharacterized protein n=1 Tax=Larimichthys crocea TaxID=215358 RepID=A0ACD3QWT3_LARCR|nr:Calpain-7 [Larimichthys crocea]
MNDVWPCHPDPRHKQILNAAISLNKHTSAMQYSVGFEMVTVSTVGDPGAAAFQKKSSGDYRCGFCYMEAEYVPAGIYNVIPTTFLPKQEGPFFLDFASTAPLKVSQLQ